MWTLCLCGLLLPACAPPTAIRKAGTDQDIARDIGWEFRKDIRFERITAVCADGTVTLQGRVDSKAVESDALRIAESYSRGTPVVSKLEIKPR